MLNKNILAALVQRKTAFLDNSAAKLVHKNIKGFS